MICTKCRRRNPTHAGFCWFDGVPLKGQPEAGRAELGRLPFPHPFHFPSGRACRNFEELALACEDEWAVATDALRRGLLEGFFGRIGRADMAAAAREGARFPDVNQGLDYFLAKIPNRVLPEPRLQVEPSTVNLGVLSVGQDSVFHLRLENGGKRLLYGWITSHCGWLLIGDGPGVRSRLVQFRSEQTVTIRVKGKLLSASTKPLEGTLVVKSNGGTATIRVTATVPVKPFAEGVLAGAASPRDLAHKARAAPQAAAPLFENGAVARWYQANGWKYPVRTAAAGGLGGIQQFFEALGLLRPPAVHLNEAAVALTARPGEQAHSALTLYGAENRLVWAHAVSDQPWLEVGRTVSSGRTATVPLLVRSVPNLPGEILTARVTVTTNGNQQFQVPVQVRVSCGVVSGEWSKDTTHHSPLTTHHSPPVRRGSAYAIAVAFLLLGFLAAVVHDWLLKPEEETSPFAVAPLIDTRPRIAVHFHDQDVDVRLGPSGLKPAEGEADQNHIPAVWEPSMRFGVTMLGQPDPGRPGFDKRLTYSERGLTNNTCVRLDGDEWLFGERPFRLQDGSRQGSSAGRWLRMKDELGTDPATGLKSDGYQSEWLYDAQKIVVTQTVSVVPGDQSRLLDTCLVRYRIENRDSRPHRVGLRLLLDTYIGGNDGVPFTIPGATRLCDSEMEFDRPEEVPDFIEALERPDLRDPGTIAHLGLKRHGPFEMPDRVTLGAWPNFRLHSRDRRCLQEKTLWDVPVLPIKTLTPPDSAVTIYWNEKELPPGRHREMAVTYGLGNVASGEAEGKLGVSVGGDFVEDGEFTVTAYVSRPAPDERVTLDVPPGFELPDDNAEQAVPPLPPDAGSPNSPVTWKVRAPGKAGQYVLRVRASSGVAQSQPITIRPRAGIFN
jgi:hypothetical protein